MVLLFGVLLYTELNKPKPIDWRRTYSKDDKIPYGGYVVYKQIEALNGDKPIKVQDDSPYEYLDDAEEIAGGKSNLIIIQSDGFIDDFEWEKIKEYVERGNNAYIASATFNNDILDVMGIEAKNEEYFFSPADTMLKGRLVNKAFKKTAKYSYKNDNSFTYFDIKESKNTTILGVVQDSLPDFIAHKHGKGKIYLHANPHIYTNIHVLKDNNYNYTFSALSYLEPLPVLWDEHYKQKNVEEDIETGSPLAFILKQSAFKWSFYTVLLGVLLFLLFRVKRRQKAIPIITPLANTSVEFTETIGRLYFNKGNHLDIAHKKIQYFAQHLFVKYTLRFDERDPDFVTHLAEKSGVKEDEVKYLVWKIAEIRKKSAITEGELFTLNQKIDEFYSKAK